MKCFRSLLLGCFFSFQLSSVFAAALDFTVNIIHPSCVGLTDGAISISPANGVPDYRVYVFGPANFYSTSFENTVLAAGDYTIRVEDANNDFKMKVFSLQPPSVANILMSDVTHICDNEYFLVANMPDKGFGMWSVVSGTGNFSDPSSHEVSVSGIGFGSNVYRWSIYTGDCVTYDEVEVINNKYPVWAGSDFVVCSRTTMLNAILPPAGATGSWSVVEGGGSFPPGSHNLPNALISELEYGQNVFRWSVVYQGCVSRDEVTVINNMPFPVNAGADQEITGSSAIMQATPVMHGWGTWSLISGSAIIEDIHNPYSNIINLRRGENVFRWTVTNGSCLQYDEVIIRCGEVIYANAGPSMATCSDAIRLNALHPVSGIGSWSVIYGSAVFEERHSPNTMVTNLSKGENVLRWTVVSGNQSSYADVVITNYAPDIAYAGSDMVTNESSVFLMASTPLIGSGTWSLVSGRGVFDDSGNSNTVIRNLLPGDNILRWTVINHYCGSYDEVVITYQINTSINYAPDSAQKLSLFPNPARDILYVSMEENTAPHRVEIHSLAGIKVLDALLNNADNSVDVSGLEAGYYIVSVHHKDGVAISRILKQ